jgi:monofunctional biosynthetic peptidoglycan transglycosylase
MKSKRFRWTFGKTLFTASALSVAASVALIASGIAFFRSEFPDVSQLKSQFPRVQYQGPKKPPLVTLQKSPPPGWVSLGEVSRAAIGAIVVSEDSLFYRHEGYDPQQMKAAFEEAVEEGHFTRGASTITQQVIKNVFLTRDRSLWRKIKELILAMRIENRVGKRKILETYFNIAEWGEGVFGIRQAAHKYFGKSPGQLTAREGAFLAMLLPSPKRYSQSFRNRALTAYAQKTVQSILLKMRQGGTLSEEEYLQALSSRMGFEDSRSAQPGPDESEESESSSNSPSENLTEDDTSGEARSE